VTRVLVIAACPASADRGSPLRVRRRLGLHQTMGVTSMLLSYDDTKLVRPPARSGASWRKVILDLELAVRATTAARRFHPDVIEGHVHEGLAIALLCRLVARNTRVVYDAHGTLADELAANGTVGAGSWLHRGAARAERWLQRKADAVVAQSAHRRDELVAAGIAYDRCVVVTDAPEDTLYDIEMRPTTSAPLRCVYTGSMAAYQGVDDILAAAAMVDGVEFRLFGSPSGRYPETAASLGLADRVVFIDPAPTAALSAELARADVALAPRRYGGNIPGKLPIYQAAGLPVVGTDVPGVRELVGDDTGVLVPPGDPVALADAIIGLRDDGAARQRLGDNARTQAKNLYSASDLAAQLATAYDGGSKTSTRSRLPLVLSVASAAGCVAMLRSRGWAMPSHVRWAVAAVAVALFVVANDVVCAARWRLLSGRQVGVGEAMRRYAEAAAAAAFLPLAGDAWRARGGRAAIGGVVTDRVVGGMVIAAGAIASSLVLGRQRLLAVGTAAVLAGVAAAWWRFGRRRFSAGAQRKAVAGGVGLSILYIAVAALAFHLLLRAAGVPIALTDSVAVTPLVLLAGAVPAIAGVGPGLLLLTWAATRAGGDASQMSATVGLLVLAQVALVAFGSASLVARTGRRSVACD
jgi:glycosyltransferase involved in cell wall biosynthesis